MQYNIIKFILKTKGLLNIWRTINKTQDKKSNSLLQEYILYDFNCFNFLFCCKPQIYSMLMDFNEI